MFVAGLLYLSRVPVDAVYWVDVLPAFVALCSGSVIVRQTTSAGASIRISRSMVRSVIVVIPSC
jgi:hypothetical protein